MEYQVILKASRDMTEADYCHCGNCLCEVRNGIKYGIWFSSLEEAKEACIKHKAYAIIDDDMYEYVWKNPDYESERDKKSFEELRKKLGKILLPH